MMAWGWEWTPGAGAEVTPPCLCRVFWKDVTEWWLSPQWPNSKLIFSKMIYLANDMYFENDRFFFWKWQKFIKNWFLEVGTLLFSILICRIQERNFNCHDFLEIETGFLVMGSGFPVMMVSPGWSVIRSALFYVLCHPCQRSSRPCTEDLACVPPP